MEVGPGLAGGSAIADPPATRPPTRPRDSVPAPAPRCASHEIPPPATGPALALAPTQPNLPLRRPRPPAPPTQPTPRQIPQHTTRSQPPLSPQAPLPNCLHLPLLRTTRRMPQCLGPECPHRMIRDWYPFCSFDEYHQWRPEPTLCNECRARYCPRYSQNGSTCLSCTKKLRAAKRLRGYVMLVSLSVLRAWMGGGLLAGLYAASPSTACVPAVSVSARSARGRVGARSVARAVLGALGRGGLCVLASLRMNHVDCVRRRQAIEYNRLNRKKRAPHGKHRGGHTTQRHSPHSDSWRLR